MNINSLRVFGIRTSNNLHFVALSLYRYFSGLLFLSLAFFFCRSFASFSTIKRIFLLELLHWNTNAYSNNCFVAFFVRFSSKQSEEKVFSICSRNIGLFHRYKAIEFSFNGIYFPGYCPLVVKQLNKSNPVHLAVSKFNKKSRSRIK